MRTSDIFSQLVYGELSQLSLGRTVDGSLDPENYPAVLAHINLGLNALYKRFALKTGSFSLQLQPGLAIYPLTSAYALYSRKGREAIRYIIDTPANPFEDNILKIEKVTTDADFELGLNDASDYACSTPSSSVLAVHADIVAKSDSLLDELKTNNLKITYRAGHNVVKSPRDVIDLPFSYWEPLLFFIASRVHNPIGMTNEFHAGNSYSKKYEMACQQLEGINLDIDQGSENTRLISNGWV